MTADEGLRRELALQALARLLRSYGHDQIDLCEDAVQEALLSAYRRWTVIPLDEQDRGRWDKALIAEGRALLDSCVRRATPGPYLLQACIAAVHAEATDTATTDFAGDQCLFRRQGGAALHGPQPLP